MFNFTIINNTKMTYPIIFISLINITWVIAERYCTEKNSYSFKCFQFFNYKETKEKVKISYLIYS